MDMIPQEGMEVYLVEEWNSEALNFKPKGYVYLESSAQDIVSNGKKDVIGQDKFRYSKLPYFG